MFGVDLAEGEVLMRKSWKQYTEDWQESMNQAFDIARKHASASGTRNKNYYDKRVRGADIEAGDRVLCRNRQTGGTGKLRNFWDSKVYVVIKKEENIPVYEIRPEKGDRRVKRVHRNEIVVCNEILPDEEVEEVVKKKGKAAPRVVKTVEKDSVADGLTASANIPVEKNAVDSGSRG